VLQKYTHKNAALSTVIKQTTRYSTANRWLVCLRRNGAFLNEWFLTTIRLIATFWAQNLLSSSLSRL